MTSQNSIPLASSAPVASSPRIPVTIRRTNSEAAPLRGRNSVTRSSVEEASSKFSKIRLDPTELEEAFCAFNKKKLLDLFRKIPSEDRQELEQLFTAHLTTENQLPLIDLITTCVQESPSDLLGRDDTPGSILWTAYIRSQLHPLFSREQLEKFANDSPQNFWKAIISTLKENAHRISYLSLLNQKIYQIRKNHTQSSDPENELIQTIVLQYFSVEITSYGINPGKCIELSKFLMSSTVSLQEIKQLLIDSLLAQVLSYDSTEASALRIQTLFNRTPALLKGHVEQVLPSLLKLKRKAITHLIVTLAKSDPKMLSETAGTVLWKAYLTVKLSSIFPENAIGELARAYLNDPLLFWSNVVQKIEAERKISKGVIAVNQQLRTLPNTTVATFFHALSLRYFIPQILDHATKSNALALLAPFAKALDKIESNEIKLKVVTCFTKPRTLE